MDPPSALTTPPKIDPNGGPTRIFEPADSLLIRAITRHKALVAFIAVALAVVGLGIGMLRSTTYTASATLQVGQVNPNSPGFLGYEQSASSLATAFSRSIGATPVLAKIDRTLGVPSTEAAPRLSAEPIPLSPAFRVIATGSSAESAMKLANVASAAVVTYESKANSANPEASSLLNDYRNASVAVRRAEAEVIRLSGQGNTAALVQAEAKRNATKVRLRAIETAYVSAVASQAPREGLVSLLAGATSASSDHTSKLELFGFLGLLIGVAAGCAAAVARERRQAARLA